MSDKLPDAKAAAHEPRRIQALRRYQILDTPPDGAFDRITSLAAQLLNAPFAVTSLVDTDRIWFKSKYGLDIPEIARAPGLCASAIFEDQPYILTDAQSDFRSHINPLVTGSFGLRFYAGVPLQTHDGHNLGMLAVMDTQPRTISEIDIEILRKLAHVVMDQMELRLAARHINDLNQQLITAHASLKIEASRDALTGLANRRAILEQLDTYFALSQREGKPLTVMIADIDFFKKINDTHGHLAGDSILTELAHRLQHAARASDSVGRLGGEEFMVLMYDANLEQAEFAAERMRCAICETPFMLADSEQGEIDVSISIGLYCTELVPAPEVRQLIQYADEALYISKNNGRNCVSIKRA